jgi:hypothetical protein
VLQILFHISHYPTSIKNWVWLFLSKLGFKRINRVHFTSTKHGDPVSKQMWQNKDSPVFEIFVNVLHGPRFYSSSLIKVTSLYKWKILKRYNHLMVLPVSNLSKYTNMCQSNRKDDKPPFITYNYASKTNLRFFSPGSKRNIKQLNEKIQDMS